MKENNMDFDVEQAKKDGYTDEEIQQYLASKQQPVPQDRPMNRYEETVGTYTSALPDALITGAELYGGKKLVLDPIVEALKRRGTSAPSATVNVQNAVPQSMAQQGAQAVNGPSVPSNAGARVPPNLSVQQGGLAQPVNPANMSALEQGVGNMVRTPAPQPSILDHASNIVRKLALSKILPAAALGSELFYTSPDEIDTLKKAEALKRMQGWKPLNER